MEDILNNYDTKYKEPEDHKPIALTNVGYKICMNLVKDG